MRPRSELSAVLRNLGNDGVPPSNVYFQPPDNLSKNYPAIEYELAPPSTQRADNKNYIEYQAYNVELITKDPDMPLIKKFPKLFLFCSFDRHFKEDNFNHYVYTVYF